MIVKRIVLGAALLSAVTGSFAAADALRDRPLPEPFAATAVDSVLFRSLAAQHPGVERWPDPDTGAAYFSVVSRFGEGNVRILTYVRVRGNRLERRTYDEAGDDLWLPAE